ncbi:MAG: hypothetical protein NTX79_01350 [Candidatus Micrarchaeota archaeon]|nr:hypothetical protein [Candidatus Micrarchaeota archaeon]
MKISKEKLMKKFSKIFSAVEAKASTSMKKGNESLAAGALFSLSSAACPCPVCIGSSLLFLINGIREKLS